MSRKVDKAAACVAAWQKRYGTIPSKHACLMICSVAEGETSCGDAWNHSGNWGAVQRRSMTAAEKADMVAGNTPHPKDDFELLIGDSDPIKGKFKAWYWRFPAGIVDPNSGLAGDEAGAWRLIKTLLEDANRDKCIKPIIDTVDAATLARMMYNTGYYGGFHDPRKMYDMPDGSQVSGRELNIADYTHAISWNLSAWVVGLSGWDPHAPHTIVCDLTTTIGVQEALNRLGVVTPALKEDGIFGPKTKAAVFTFQRDAGLVVDGIVGPKTRAALADALAALQP